MKKNKSRFTPREIWKHNGFRGMAMLAKKNMWTIYESSTATAKSKSIAFRISSLLFELEESLKERNE